MVLSAAALAGLMIVASGAVHAAVNVILKSGRDKMSGRALLDGFSAVLVLPFAFFVPFPVAAAPWLAASWVVHLAYVVCLVQAFSHSDMLVAYPIARGVAPALAATAAVVLLGERVTAPTAAGIGLITLGVLTTTGGVRVDRRGLGWALATGVCIALYTVLDAEGARRSPSAASYIVWAFLTFGGGIGLVFMLWRGPRFLLAAQAEWRWGLAAGALSILTYGLALAAYRLAPVGRLAALRETSILFGVLLAILVLKERPTPGRVAGAAAVAAGAMILLL